MRYVWTALLAIAFATVGKLVGLLYAKTYLTDDTSAILTECDHKSALKRFGRAGAGSFGAWLLMICLSSLIARWITAVGWIPLIALNGCLAVLTGTAASLSRLLRRPSRWDALQARIEQRERLIEVLKKFVPAVIVLVLAAAGPISAGDSCFFGVDVSPSVNASDARAARAFLKSTAFEAAARFGCAHVVVEAVGCEVRFARRVWLDVPSEQPPEDCSKAEPEPLTGHSRFWDYVRGVADSRKQDAVHRCEEAQETRARKRDAERAAFAEAFDSAFEMIDPPRCSRITASIRDALGSGLHRAIIVASDAIDNPPASLRDFVVPTGTRVIIILTRPKPEYARVEDSLNRAAAWSRIPRVSVVTTAELRSDLWRTVVPGSPR